MNALLAVLMVNLHVLMEIVFMTHGHVMLMMTVETVQTKQIAVL